MALASAAKEVQHSWNVLAGIDQHEHPGDVDYLDDYGANYLASMKLPVTVKWAGPIGPLVALLAREANVSPSVVGSPPPSPILVYINAVNEPVGDVLRDVGFQAGKRAGVRVIPFNGGERVELVYANP